MIHYEQWRRARLGDIALSIRNGLFTSRPNDEGRGVPILRISAVRDGRVTVAEPRYVEGIDPEQVDRFSVRPGDILITRYNGSRHLVGIPGLVPDHPGQVIHPDKLIRVVVNRDLADPRFVTLQLQAESVRRYLEPRIRTTAGQSGISGADVRGIPLVVPPLERQREIVARLEEDLAHLESADLALDSAAARVDTLSESVVAGDPHLADADLRPLGELLAAPLANGRSVPTADQGFPVLRLTAMKDGRIDLTERKTGRWDAAAASPYLVTQDDVFAARGNGSLKLVGRAARVIEEPDPVAFPDTMIRMRPNPDRVCSGFLTSVWNSRVVRRQIERAAKTTAGIYKVNQKDLLSVRLPVPSIDLQVELMIRVSAASDATHLLGSSIDAARRRSAALRRSLLQASFSSSADGGGADGP